MLLKNVFGQRTGLYIDEAIRQLNVLGRWDPDGFGARTLEVISVIDNDNTCTLTVWSS